MNHLPQKQFRILAIAPSTRGFGFAVLEGQETLVDWGVKSVKGDKNKQTLAKVKALIAHYQPGVLVLQDTKHSRRALRIRTLSKRIISMAATRKVRVALFSREQVMQVFFADDQGTKYALAEILASFVGLCHHLFYAAMYGDYRLPQEPTPRLAWEHFARKAAPYESIGPPPKGPWIERISHGIAWLIFHEFGHFAHRRSINSSKFREAFLKPEMACEECEADVSAYSHLSMRLRAQDPLNTLDTQAELCLGIEGVLHIAEALAALDRGGLGRKEPPRLNDGPFTPSAYLRRTFLRDFYESAQGLGLLPSNLTRGPKRLALRSPASRSPSTPN